MLWLFCRFVVLYFQESSNMEAAYGLAITITMIMTSSLLFFYLKQKNVPHLFLGLFVTTFALSKEHSLLPISINSRMVADFSIALACTFLIIMLGWYLSRRIKNRHISWMSINTSIFSRIWVTTKQFPKSQPTWFISLKPITCTRSNQKLCIRSSTNNPNGLKLTGCFMLILFDEPDNVQRSQSVHPGSSGSNWFPSGI